MDHRYFNKVHSSLYSPKRGKDSSLILVSETLGYFFPIAAISIIDENNLDCVIYPRHNGHFQFIHKKDNSKFSITYSNLIDKHELMINLYFNEEPLRLNRVNILAPGETINLNHDIDGKELIISSNYTLDSMQKGIGLDKAKYEITENPVSKDNLVLKVDVIPLNTETRDTFKNAEQIFWFPCDIIEYCDKFTQSHVKTENMIYQRPYYGSLQCDGHSEAESPSHTGNETLITEDININRALTCRVIKGANVSKTIKGIPVTRYPYKEQTVHCEIFMTVLSTLLLSKFRCHNYNFQERAKSFSENIQKYIPCSHPNVVLIPCGHVIRNSKISEGDFILDKCILCNNSVISYVDII